MTSRERLLCVLSGGIPDQVPISPFITEFFLSYYYDSTHTDRVRDAVRLAEEFDLDIITRQHILPEPSFMLESRPNWDVSLRYFRDAHVYYRETTIKTPVRELHQLEATPWHPWNLYGAHYAPQEYLLKSPADFEALKKYCPELPKTVIDKIRDSVTEARKIVGNRGLTCPWTIGGAYNRASQYISMESLLTDVYENEDYYEEYMQFFTDLVIKNHEIFADSVCDGVGYQGNIANASIMSADFFREFVLPYEQQAVKVLSDAGKYTIYHNCGKAKNFYSCYRDMGITVWETVSTPPQGDNDLQDAKDFFGDSIVLSGNFDQVHFLKEATPMEIEEAARRQMEIGKVGGHYLFAASDYIEPGTPIENFRAFLRGGRAAATY